MQFHIRQLVLWPKDNTLEPRLLCFESTQVNLITGRSRTGKSAITYIIDYVLGSGKCAIPVGPIRDTVSWYGLLLDLGSSELLAARQEPGSRIESGNYYLDEREHVTIPSVPVKNTNRDAFKHRMNLLAGLPTLDFDPERTDAGFLGRPSFRDMAAFTFLPQHVVANPYTLFFKADTSEHRQKLRTIFPFVLRAVTAEHLVAEHEHAELERQLRKLQAQWERREQAAEAWRAEAFGLHGRAVELGLLPSDARRPDSLADCVGELATIPAAVGPDRILPARAPGATLAGAVRLEEVRRLEREVDRQLAGLRTRLQRIRALKGTMGDFGSVASEQAARMHGTGWFQQFVTGNAACPVCGSEHERARTRVNQMAAALADLSNRRRAAGDAPVALEREEQELLVGVQAQEEHLRELRTERGELETERAKSGGQTLDEVYRFVGRVEEAIKNIRQTDDSGDLRTQIAQVRERMRTLTELLDRGARERRMNSALQLFSRHLSHYAIFLDLERSTDAINLKVSELTLIFASPDGNRDDFLWEIGSGANWMGYHVATLLALHEVFLSGQRSPVPTFLLIDQPSQVYFPGGWPADDAERGASSHDVQATRRIFETLIEGLRRMDHRLQIIVTEHADDQTLAGIQEIHTVANWHGEADRTDYLIPRGWLRRS